MVGQSPSAVGINNATNDISTIGNRGEIEEILEDLRLAPYDTWGVMEQDER